MWIRILRDQVKPWGIFRKGQVASLPIDRVKTLDADSWQETKVDDATLAKRSVAERIDHFNRELITLDTLIRSAEARLTGMMHRRKELAAKVVALGGDLQSSGKTQTKAQTKPKAASKGK